MSFYCGEIGLSITEFNDCNMQDLYNISYGYNRRSEKQWLHTRFIGSLMINTTCKDKVKPQDLIKLSLDKDKYKIVDNRTPEQLKQDAEWVQKVERAVKQHLKNKQ